MYTLLGRLGNKNSSQQPLIGEFIEHSTLWSRLHIEFWMSWRKSPQAVIREAHIHCWWLQLGLERECEVSARQSPSKSACPWTCLGYRICLWVTVLLSEWILVSWEEEQFDTRRFSWRMQCSIVKNVDQSSQMTGAEALGWWLLNSKKYMKISF